jgi:hypothetical protein
MCKPYVRTYLNIDSDRNTNTNPNSNPNSNSNRHQTAVVLMGATGKHLSADDPSVVGITESMVAALQTPSEGVQKAVADCLVQLVQVRVQP